MTLRSWILPLGTLVLVACGGAEDSGNGDQNAGGTGSGGAPASGGAATGGDSASGGSTTGGAATGGSGSIELPDDAPFTCELVGNESPCNLLISSGAPYPSEFALLGCGVSEQRLRFDDLGGSGATLALEFAEPLGTGAPGSYTLTAVEPELGSGEAWTTPGTNCTAEILCHQHNPSFVFENRYVLVGRVQCTEPFEPVQGTTQPLDFQGVWFRSFVDP